MINLVVVGAGGHGLVVADAAAASPEFAVVGFVDDDTAAHNRTIDGWPVLGGPDVLPDVPHDGVVAAIGDNIARRALVERLIARGERFVAIAHPRAIVADRVKVGEGAMVLAGSVVNPATRVGQHAILNTGCTVDHHCDVGDFAHVAPGAHIGGGVKIGLGALIGLGASLLPGTTVGDWAVVGAGAVVTGDVDPNRVVVGIPARALPRTPA